MDEVKRYTPQVFDDGSNRWAEMDDDKFGAWVRHSDYTALRARLAEVEAALKLHQDLDAINVAEVARLTALKDALAGDKINLVSELRQVKAGLATARRDALREALDIAEDDVSGACQKCGHPRNNHPYRHPFVGRAVGDTVAAIRALITQEDKSHE